MKYSALVLFSLSVLAGGVVNGRAQPASLQSSPPVKDLGSHPPAPDATGPANPVARPEIRLLHLFDRNGDGHLDAAERRAAREFLAKNPPPTVAPPPNRPGQPVALPVALEPVRPGARVGPADAAHFPEHPIYDPTVVRTLFLNFEEQDWEAELTEFAPTDIPVPARLTVDGREMAGVGVHFRRPAPAIPVPAGYKRSLDLTLNLTDPNGRLGAQTELVLIAPDSDATFVRTMLYDRVAREYLPTPKANYVRLVINGENWGVYLSRQPLDANFVQENFHTDGGARWDVDGTGNLADRGGQADAYRADYRLQSAEDPAAWARLAALCRTLKQAEPGQLEVALSPLLDIDGALRFFALENALINQSGYGSTNGGYGLYLDPAGLFHLVPLDADASLRLVEVHEYGQAPRREAAGPSAEGKGKSKGKAGEPKVPGYDRTHFPKKTGTDLAMLLSYSFVNKADTDFDGKISQGEWHDFARGWFFVMDEDHVGSLTHDQFLAKVRLLVTPTSIADGRTHQTFGKDDPAALIGGELFADLDTNHDGQITRDEFVGTFDRWFGDWTAGKSAFLTQETLQTAFDRLFTQTTFEADQNYIAVRTAPKPDDDAGEGGRGGGRRGGSGIGLGPLHLPGFGLFGGKGGADQTVITYSEELVPLAGLDDAAKPLLARLLAAPALRARYLKYVSDITDNWLSWKQLGPTAQTYHDLIAPFVEQDTHKATSYEHFVKDFDQDTTVGPREGEAAASLKAFVDERGNYLRKDDTVTGNSGTL